MILLYHVKAQDYSDYSDCPTKEQLVNENGYPAVFQQDSTTVLVNWTDLWPSLEWPSSCVSELSIVINDDPQIIDFQDLDEASTIVKVEPCEELNIVVRLKLNNSEEIDSYFNNDNKTYEGPAFKEDASIRVEYIENAYYESNLQFIFFKTFKKPKIDLTLQLTSPASESKATF